MTTNIEIRQHKPHRKQRMTRGAPEGLGLPVTVNLRESLSVV